MGFAFHGILTLVLYGLQDGYEPISRALPSSWRSTANIV